MQPVRERIQHTCCVALRMHYHLEEERNVAPESLKEKGDAHHRLSAVSGYMF